MCHEQRDAVFALLADLGARPVDLGAELTELVPRLQGAPGASWLPGRASAAPIAGRRRAAGPMRRDGRRGQPGTAKSSLSSLSRRSTASSGPLRIADSSRAQARADDPLPRAATGASRLAPKSPP